MPIPTQNPASPTLVAEVVRQIPLPPGKINLNAGTLFPTPIPVQKRAAALRAMMAADPSDFLWRKSPVLIQSARSELAEFLRVSPDELLLLPNVTYAINLIVSSLALIRGTEILTTDHDYGAMLFTWQRWAAVKDWNIRTLELPPMENANAGTSDEIVEAFRAALTPSTRVVFLYHVTSPTGIVMPLKEICALARERDILTVVDGAHAPGSFPLNLTEIGADFYASNTHKWIMGPATGGFLHVSRHRRNDLRALVTSWGWPYARSEAFEDSGNGGSKWQWDLEFHGTADRVPQMVIPEALAFRRALTGQGGDAALIANAQYLADYARATIPLPCRTNAHIPQMSPLLVFEVPACDPTIIRDRLYTQYHIECPVTVAAGRHYLRVSLGAFNTTSDIDRLAAAVREIFR